ncbi:MAG: DUF938 domain-containing protein [Alphaproteobacteria bacterium]|nr:DUF938 domain-containing protein [Alphaproteobacteria bacterium]
MPQTDSPTPPDLRRHAPATLRNRDSILAVLVRALPGHGLVLEVASGSGEHAAFFAPCLTPRRWQPSDADSDARASIAAYAAAAACPTLMPPIALDANAGTWPIAAADAVVCINMIHIAPWSAAQGLIAGAATILPTGGLLYLYGPFTRGGRHTAPSNQTFDAGLRARDPAWGVRDLDDVARLAASHGLALDETIEMPANNLSVLFRRS